MAGLTAEQLRARRAASRAPKRATEAARGVSHAEYIKAADRVAEAWASAGRATKKATEALEELVRIYRERAGS